MQTRSPYLKIKQPLSTTAFSGEERGLPLRGGSDVRIVVHAPAGQTLVGDLTVKLALRHGATGLFLPIGASDFMVFSSVTTGQRGVVVAEIPAHGNEGDELVARVTGGTSGTPLDVEDAGSIYLVLEPLQSL